MSQISLILIGLYDTVKGQKGRIDILFANAGIAEFAPLGSITESHFDKIFSVNVKGLLFTVQKALPLFQDGGSIILTASVGGSKGTPAFSVYDATKVSPYDRLRVRGQSISKTARSGLTLSVLVRQTHLSLGVYLRTNR